MFMPENYPYRRIDNQKNSITWQLTPAVKYFTVDGGISSLHFRWDKHQLMDTLRTGKLEIQDIKDAVQEILNAVKSFNDLVKRDDFIAPASLIINTPNKFLRRFFPREYVNNTLGDEVFKVDIEEYMKENQLLDKKDAWVHFMNNRIVPNVHEVTNRLKSLESRIQPD